MVDFSLINKKKPIIYRISYFFVRYLIDAHVHYILRNVLSVEFVWQMPLTIDTDPALTSRTLFRFRTVIVCYRRVCTVSMYNKKLSYNEILAGG